MPRAVEVVQPEQVTPTWMTRALHACGIEATIAHLGMAPVATGQLGDQMRKCALEEARVALAEAVLLHAASWNDRAAVVDWQTSSFLGTGMDVACLLGGSPDREIRRAHGQSLLRVYHDDLLRHGVTAYSFDRLLRDYADYSFAAIAVAIAATAIVTRTAGDDMLMHMVRGAALQALDNDALDDLPD